MKPINERLDLNFTQALRCAEYRLPTGFGLGYEAFAHSLGLRYGLLGAAAAHHLLSSCNPDEEAQIQEHLDTWPIEVFEHMRCFVLRKIEFSNGALPNLVSGYADQPLRTYLSMYRRLCPLDWALTIAKDAYLQEHNHADWKFWNFWKRRKEQKALAEAAEESFRYAMAFYERRLADLEELPEIALIGE